MLRGFYTAGTGMLTQRDRMDVITSNLTNADTTAFKSDSLVLGRFQDMIIERFNDPSGNISEIGSIGGGAHISRVITSFEQGNLEGTGRSCDFALEGSGFFAVSTPNGDRYTRDGNFFVNDAGYLVNSSGYYVQGNNGRINVGSDNFTVDEQGNVYVDDVLTDKLKIVSFVDTSQLRKEGDNLYAGTNPQTDIDTKVKQGCLEGSNVDVSGELATMLSVSRAYETNQRVLRMIDSTLDKAVNDVGRV